MHEYFPLPELAKTLLPQAFDARDGAHDEGHLLRVWRNVEAIRGAEGGDRRLLLAATLLHDCVWVDKRSPERSSASRLAAGKASEVLTGLGWTIDEVGRVAHAIEAHSFSAGIAPRSLEARILQDADRLDAMGFIGVARCMYLAGAHGASIHHPTDPAGVDRPLEDQLYALDHFRTKLLGLGEKMQTAKGREMAAERIGRLKAFYRGLLEEVGERTVAPGTLSIR
ncbi:HD domain-containing protein [Allosediminivita pacifica]|uniref:HD/PDEase domain-containing protein n=1 Tax=Allosediminivita pacifica TaxID=1267769 RepID=A0A2T6B7Q3_9RHOB|nr:HD domain-containing protein [Allosediminivita pacifica]PTX52083.1 uncharacterized protein C8N44_102128 [Allosediminivita pacifica]